MMANNENEPAKLLLPYLQRADELQKHEPLVAYYCRLYAMERGLKIPQSGRTKTTNAILISLMKQLEKDKKSLKLVPDDSLYLEGFASNVFAKADKQDRAGRADLSTAKTFYAASIFFEILNQFGEVQPDLEQKQKYAAWKAADIRKALKEGRKPEPGPPIDDEDLSLMSSTTSDAYDFEASRSATDSEPQPDQSPRFRDETNHQHLSGSTQSLPSYPSQDFQPPPRSNDISEKPPYSQGYHHQTYPQEPPPHFPQEHHQNFPQDSHQNFPQDSRKNFPQEHHQHFPQESHQQLPQNYPSHELSSVHSLPNFQSYPSFSDSSLPAVPTHYPYSQDSSPHAPNYPSSPQYSMTSNRNETVSLPAPNPTPTFQYDSNYLPAPEKIVEAHKAARFAVGALAFDDVPIAIDFLKKSLELLTNPSAGQ